MKNMTIISYYLYGTRRIVHEAHIKQMFSHSLQEINMTIFAPPLSI